jgi:hypothetical protein
MFRRALRVVALLALAAAGGDAPQRTDHWTVERQVPDEEIPSPTQTVCDDIADLSLDRFTECEIPVFIALYLSISFSSWHVRVALPVAGLAPTTTGCDPTASALFLPCFDPPAGYEPVDCLSDESVRLVDADWVGA